MSMPGQILRLVPRRPRPRAGLAQHVVGRQARGRELVERRLDVVLLHAIGQLASSAPA